VVEARMLHRWADLLGIRRAFELSGLAPVGQSLEPYSQPSRLRDHATRRKHELVDERRRRMRRTPSCARARCVLFTTRVGLPCRTHHSPTGLNQRDRKARNGLVDRWARLGSNQRPPACEDGAVGDCRGTRGDGLAVSGLVRRVGFPSVPRLYSPRLTTRSLSPSPQNATVGGGARGQDELPDPARAHRDASGDAAPGQRALSRSARARSSGRKAACEETETTGPGDLGHAALHLGLDGFCARMVQGLPAGRGDALRRLRA
jgi:hypothetical protein